MTLPRREVQKNKYLSKSLFPWGRLLLFLAGICFTSNIIDPTIQKVSAQDQTTYPVYVIQTGDTLNLIALRFNVSVDDLIAANQITDPNILTEGTRLIIPGLTGVKGVLSTEAIGMGDSLNSISVRFGADPDTLIRINRILSPKELYLGSNLIIPQSENVVVLNNEAVVETGKPVLALALLHRVNPWLLKASNGYVKDADILVGSSLYYATQGEGNSAPDTMGIKNLKINPAFLIQGGTTQVSLVADPDSTVSGRLGESPLNFFKQGDNQFIALQGIYAFANIGIIPLIVEIKSSDGTLQEFNQNVLVSAGSFVEDPPLSVDPATIDPAITKPEEDLVKKIITPANPTRYWQEIFREPVDEPVCIKSWFGNRRSYNGSDFTFFHGGIDYGVCANLNIYAPAPGKVVYVSQLTVRGNTTFIDHGWGIYSGYFHQEETKVKEGDIVEAGQLIGIIGKTGRVTGPHLHWEIWVNGFQVLPTDWIEQIYPSKQ